MTPALPDLYGIRVIGQSNSGLRIREVKLREKGNKMSMFCYGDDREYHVTGGHHEITFCL